MSISDYLPTVQERGRYTGPFSTIAEYHAFAVGFIIVLVDPGLLEPVIAYAVGSGGGKARRSGHVQDAAQELAYTGLGAGIAILVRAMGVVP